MPSATFSLIYNRIARVAAASTNADVAFITLRINHKLSILGSHGLHHLMLDGDWDPKRKLVQRSNISYVPNVQRDPNFKNHPLLLAAPFARTLVHIPVQGQYTDIEASISLVNIGQKWPLTAGTTAILTDLAMLVGDALKISDFLPSSGGKKDNPIGMREAKGAKYQATDTRDTAGRFLLSTLRRKTSIRHRKDVAFVTLRTWITNVKAYQIEALKIAKTNADEQLIEDISTEMAEHIRHLFGSSHFHCVVPVPCGHSKQIECLSVKIARRVADMLKVPFSNLLQSAPRPGTSHPSKNASLKPPKIKGSERYNAILLIDDVATSGRHIELSVKSLRTVADHVTAMAWIGAM